MEFKATTYHSNLLKDIDRLAIFNEAIKSVAIDISEKSNTENQLIAFDLGCGSGILSYFASNYFDEILSIDCDSKIIELTKENLNDFENIEVACSNILDYKFLKKSDLIICEMLDTALIDEEEVPILNYARKFLKDDGKIIPQSIFNFIEPIYMKTHYLQYEDNDSHPIYEVLGDSIKYSEFNFLEDIDSNFSSEISLKIAKNLDIGFNDEMNLNIKCNGIKLTSYTKLAENIISGPTPMLNPPILIPIEEIAISPGDSIKIQLEYIMGQGIETIKTKVLGIN